MKKLSELFYTCAYEGNWQVVGEDVNYKFVEEGSTLYIYFQGSSSTTDWIRNFLFKKKPYKDMESFFRVHRGFLSAWKEVEDIIIEKIQEKDIKLVFNRKKKKYEDKESFKWKEIVVVGYSHGGALAGLCHECVWYYREDLRENGLHGFGFEAPRFYGCMFVKEELKERWKNFIVIRDGSDIVTHCPPTIFGYTHVGSILKIKGDSSLVENKWLPKFIKYHYPQVVYDGLKKYEEANK